VLKAPLGERFAAYPALALLSGDARFAQRPRAERIVARGKHYLRAVQDNPPDLREAAEAPFAHQTPETADAATRENQGATGSRAGSGPTRRRRRMPARR
jgi:hypothetical protein